MPYGNFKLKQPECDSERLGSKSFHDEKTVMDRMFVQLLSSKIDRIEVSKAWQGDFYMQHGWLTVITRG